MKNSIFEILEDWNCDIHTAMDRFLNNEELFLSCLKTFARDPEFAKLNDAVQTESYEEAFEYAHNLKGVSGNLGLTPLYQSLVTIVESLRSKNYQNIHMELSDVNEQFSLYQTFIGE